MRYCCKENIHIRAHLKRLFDVTRLLNPFADKNAPLKLEQQDNLLFFNPTLDNISRLVEVPELLTILLFGLGHLGFSRLARRRRHALRALA